MRQQLDPTPGSTTKQGGDWVTMGVRFAPAKRDPASNIPCALTGLDWTASRTRLPYLHVLFGKIVSRARGALVDVIDRTSCHPVADWNFLAHPALFSPFPAAENMGRGS